MVMGTVFPKILVTIPCRSMEELESKDDELGELREIILEHYENSSECCLYFTFPTEKGYGNAIKKSWMQNPGFDCYVLIDNDFAMPPEQVTRLISKVLYEGFDCVVGARQNRLGSGSPLRGIVSRTFNLLIRFIFSTGLSEHFSGFRAYSAEFVKWALPECNESHWMFQPESTIVSQALNLKVCEVPIDYNSQLRPTKISRLPKDAMDIIPGLIRLIREWKFGVFDFIGLKIRKKNWEVLEEE